MTTLLILLVAVVSASTYFVRYRWMTKYSRLPPSPKRTEPQVEIYPDILASDLKPGLSNYLDEFLSAIKVFGYLERPVFHELTRTMQTKKLIAGETLLLEEEKGFCLVVDGSVQIFVRSSRKRTNSPLTKRPTSSDAFANGESDPDEDHNYQLLTEVSNGAPMSSLFSVLSLFTDNVNVRPDDHASSRRPTFSRPDIHRSGSSTDLTRNVSPIARPASRHVSQVSEMMDSTVPPFSLDDENPFEAPLSPTKKPQRTSPATPTASAHPDIVARASSDTTIAIIPASAFHRLTRIYPKATAQIVQVILTRLQRVTLATANSYLGLTDEVLSTEKLMDSYLAYDLPDFLHGAALERLKDKFQQEIERAGSQDSTKGIALHNTKTNRYRASHSLDKAPAQKLTSQSPSVSPSRRMNGALSCMPSHRDSAFVTIESRAGISAGDLLTTNRELIADNTRQRPMSIHHASHSLRDAQSPMQQRDFNPLASPAHVPASMQHQESIDEDSLFRESILECMLQAIGLDDVRNPQKATPSVHLSPRVAASDARRQKAAFTSALGLLGPLNGLHADTESVTSASALSISGPIDLMSTYCNDVEIVYFPKDAVLVEQGERNPGLYYVIDGFLDVSVPVEDGQTASDNIFGTAPQQRNTKQREQSKTPKSRNKSNKDIMHSESLFLIKPGSLAGYIGTVGSHRSFINVTAKTDVYVGFLPKAAVEKIVERFPAVLLTLAKRLTNLLPRLILHIDFALEWVQVNAGQIIYQQEDESDAIYIVLNGRLRVLQESDNGSVRVVSEFGQGDSVGELEVMTETSRPGSLHAIRDTELAKFPKSLFNSLALEHTGITIKISKIIASRMRTLLEDPTAGGRAGPNAQEMARTTSNLRTVTVLPVAAGVPVVEFGNRLLSALHQINAPGGVVSLNQTVILNHLGRHAFNRMGKLKLSQYLADLEEKYGLLLYIADTNVKSPWTQTCISQADCIFLVGLADGPSDIGEYERFLLTTKTTARKELVLLHSERYCPPGLTRRWLRNRPWINGSHHHIQMSSRATSAPVQPQLRRFGTVLRQRVQVLQAEIQKYTSRKVRQTPLYSAETPFKGDFHRLARRLCGTTVGLVLGGGGARGIAHVGVIRAMEEAGIPIDIIGGTSIGSFIGALYAWDGNVVPMYGRAKKFSGRMGSLWRFALDLTYPAYVVHSADWPPLTFIVFPIRLATSSIAAYSRLSATPRLKTFGSSFSAILQTFRKVDATIIPVATCGAMFEHQCLSRDSCHRCATTVTCCWTVGISTICQSHT